MTLYTLPSAIKAFFTILSSLYIFGKSLNVQTTRRKFLLLLVYSSLITTIVYYIQISISLHAIFSITILLIPFCHFTFKVRFPQALFITLLSIGSSYALFTLLVMTTIPITSLLMIMGVPNLLTPILMLSFVGILQNLFVFFLFRTKRLRDGIPGIISIFSGNTGVFAGSLLVLSSSCFYLKEDAQTPYFLLLLIFFILALGIIIWLWYQKSIQTDYINKNNFQQIDILESKLQERDAELERLSKIIHKDNKLLAALELSTRELLTDTASEKAQSLLQELNRFSKERSETLHAYESGPAALPETGLFSVDTMIRYLHQRALKHKIEFQLSLEGELAGITDVICEQDLCTIIADLGENAIIATRESEIKNIRLSMERKPDGYALYFYDSGEPFAKEVLESLGKKRYTTHAETGGSGIGLMTTSELVTKYHGAFYITDEEIPEPYTKCVVVKLLIP